MAETQDRKDKRTFEADTLDIQAARLVPTAGDRVAESTTPADRRKPGKSSISGETVRRIIERLKGI